MSKRLSLLLKSILSIILAIISILVIIALYGVVKYWIFLFLALAILCIGVPFVMRSGFKTLNKEREYVFSQYSRNAPIHYNTGSIIIATIKVLGVFWLLIPSVFLVPGGLYVAVLPIITVAIFVLEAKVSNYWDDIGWSKAKYWLMNICIYLLGIFIGIMLLGFLYK